MILVKVRSPFIITVAETGQIGSKIELFIWRTSETEPTSPIYTFSKNIASASQISTYYNVSNYVKEYIDNVINNDATYADAMSNKDWCYFRVKRYKLVGSTYTELSNTLYVGFNGYTQYSDGKQQGINNSITSLTYNNVSKYYPDNTFSSGGVWQGRETLGTFCFIAEKTAIQTLSLTYTAINGSGYVTQNLSNGLAGIFAYEVPNNYVVNGGSGFSNGTRVQVSLAGSGTTITQFTYPIEECKYTPVRCVFINRFGGWETLWFFKAQTNNISVKGTDYKLTQSSVSYDTPKGQYQTFNINGKQTAKLNTGFVDENYSELITDLLLSETVLLDDKPVTVKTQGSDLKTSLKDRLINYEIDFEYAYNLINDVV